uniref:Uncharacterized protein n=1 Tax=Romanomermis culicivorax TaxID=13658 RepID=A0A915I541_ROMCU
MGKSSAHSQKFMVNGENAQSDEKQLRSVIYKNRTFQTIFGALADDRAVLQLIKEQKNFLKFEWGEAVFTLKSSLDELNIDRLAWVYDNRVKDNWVNDNLVNNNWVNATIG